MQRIKSVGVLSCTKMLGVLYGFAAEPSPAAWAGRC